MIGQICLDLGNQLSVVGAIGIKPEDHGTARNASTFYREFYPILNRCVFDSAHTPNVAGLDIVTVHNSTGLVDDFDAPGIWDFKGRVMRTVLFGLLCHQTDIGRRPNAGRIQRAVSFAVGNHFLINRGVAPIRNHGLRIV